MPSLLFPARALGFALVTLVLSVLFAPSLDAQTVPQLINYQGRVAVSGVNFEGSGSFKFALVNADGSETYWSNDGSSDAGSEPAAAVTLPVSKGLYTVLLGDASISNMTAVPATVFVNEDVRLRVWFNDGTHGSQRLSPDQRVAAVGYALMADGVKAGGVTGAMIAAGAVGSAQIADGAIGSPQLAPGAAAANLGASGQSGVASGGVLFSPTDNNAALLAAGYVRIGATVTPDTWSLRAAVSPSARSRHTAVWTGAEMVVWGGYGVGVLTGTGTLSPTGGFLNGGARYNPASNSWSALSLVAAPNSRAFHTAVWTGSEMIVWGGTFSDGSATTTYFSDGARYNPATDIWVSLGATGSPAGRQEHTAVWTGSEMIVWGGLNANGARNDGARYNLSSGAWSALPASALGARSGHSAVWTGAEMIVWGGFLQAPLTNYKDGARYNPVANAWTALPVTGAPTGRALPAVVWTGSEMIVWGGSASGSTLGDGARYDPAANAWTALPAAGAPTARGGAKAVWTGGEMIVFGGFDSSNVAVNTGGRYDLAADAWSALSGAGAPAPRRQHTAVWTGSEMIIWGGSAGPTGPALANFNDGGRYDPAADAWTSVAVTGASAARTLHAAVWTGSEMIVWGGTNVGGAPVTDGGRFSPALNAWTPVASAGEPSPRYQHTVTWTGSEMIVFGGFDSSNVATNAGSRYDPASDAWTALPSAGAPPVRGSHTAVWTGSEMIVFGGTTGSNALDTGGRYDPAADAWTGITAPAGYGGRSAHTAVWTGSEMIVWGGSSGGAGLNTGARYRPAGNAWSLVSTLSPAPSARFQHTAVWTGSEMIVFGGRAGASAVAGGARYNPAANTWTLLSTTSAPIARYQHTAVWTGSDMIVWGGSAGGNGYLSDGARFSVASNAWTTLTPGPAPAARAQHVAAWTGAEMIVFGGFGILPGYFTAFNDVWSLTPGRTLYLYQRP